VQALRVSSRAAERDVGLSAAQLFVLDRLAGADQALCVNELAQRTLTHQSSVSVVVLESASDACTLLQSQAVNNTSTVSIVLGIQTPDGRIAPPTVAGTYEIDGPLFRDPGTKLAAVAFNVFGGCGPGTTANAVSGSVHLTHVATAPDGNPRGIDGSFNARFDTGETFSGAFHVSLCPSARLLVGICR